MQLDILTEIHEVRKKIYNMKLKEREQLMRDAEEIAQLLNQGNIKRATEKVTQLTTE
ncbi:MAG: hypothetical protein AOA65_0315 [Candidatus Bathyarchaeota archaeon BA1]|nr:MAG: hypothetical protein AOA65_0315 [Candidatus Bathyarchaeota archaeon BA1]